MFLDCSSSPLLVFDVCLDWGRLIGLKKKSQHNGGMEGWRDGELEMEKWRGGDELLACDDYRLTYIPILAYSISFPFLS